VIFLNIFIAEEKEDNLTSKRSLKNMVIFNKELKECFE